MIGKMFMFDQGGNEAFMLTVEARVGEELHIHDIQSQGTVPAWNTTAPLKSESLGTVNIPKERQIGPNPHVPPMADK